MSSNKTIIPGMENPYNPSSSDSQFSGGQVPPQMEASPSKGTCVPNGGVNPMMEPTFTQSNQKPVVGFLYSISRTGSGEYWPVHIGSNTIGRSSECDICLSEGTVSDKHATLVVRVMKNPEKVIASICDSSSTIGSMINGESLGFEQRECFNGDILTIGAHYDLLFILVDARQIGLKVCDAFIPMQSTKPQGFNFAGGQSGPNPTVDLPGNNPYAPPTATIRRTRGYNDDGSMGSGRTQGLSESPEPGDGQPQGGGRTIFM